MSKEGKLFFICVYTLVCTGIVMTYSASAIYAEQLFKSPLYFLKRHAFYILAGTFLLFWAAALKPEFWKSQSKKLLILSFALLVFVLIPGIGHQAGGAQRWIALGPVSFQPVEISKIAVCLYLSDYLSKHLKGIQRGEPGVLLPPLFIVGVTCTLILIQPDLGSSVFIFLVSAILFFVAGLRFRYVLGASLFFVPALYLLVLRVPYRLSRVTAYLNPWEDPQGSGFQIIQSLLAFGMGGFRGVGLGESTQKLFYLPQSYNDFIFSIIGEELGFLGALFVLVLYGVIFVLGLRISSRARSIQDKLLAIAFTLLIVLQASINMLVATGLIPTKGLPLPFVSYGGSSLIFNLVAVGFLLGLDRSYHEGSRWRQRERMASAGK